MVGDLPEPVAAGDRGQQHEDQGHPLDDVNERGWDAGADLHLGRTVEQSREGDGHHDHARGMQPGHQGYDDPGEADGLAAELAEDLQSALTEIQALADSLAANGESS